MLFFDEKFGLELSNVRGHMDIPQPVSNSSTSEAEEIGLDCTPAELRARLNQALQDKNVAEEALRETLAAMIKHQQLGKSGNFRYNTVTGLIVGTEEVFKIFCFPKGTRSCTADEWLAKIHPDDRDRIAKQFFQAISEGGDLRLEYRIVVETGERHMRCDGEPDLGFKGEPTYFGVVTDLTERRATEQAQRVMEADLAAALRLASMGELAGSIIHEVNQPLTAIATSASACRRWLAAGPERIERALASMDRIVDEGERASAIISGLKSVIRNVSTDPTPFDLDGATREVCSLIMSELAREKVLLETRFSDGLPPAFGNRVQIQQVIMNLARNAIEAMRGNQMRRVLTVETACQDGMLCLRMSDNGAGLGVEDPEVLFKPLYTSKIDGMGLGLSISRKIAIAHGGSLRAKPRSGAGAEFHLLLPLEQRGHD